MSASPSSQFRCALRSLLRPEGFWRLPSLSSVFRPRAINFPSRRPYYLEMLEQREVLTVNATFLAGSLTLTGDNAADAVTFFGDGTVTGVNGVTTLNDISAGLTTNDIANINFDTTAGASLTLAFAVQDYTTTGSLSINQTNTGAVTVDLNGVSIATALTVNVTSSVAIGDDLSATTLNLTAGAAIAQSAGAMTVSGTTTVNAGAANNITLNQAANNFGTVAVTNAAVVALTDVSGVTISNATAATSLTVSAGGAIGLTGTISAPTLSLTAGGMINQTAGSITSSLTTTLDAGAANAITLNQAANDFATVVVTNGSAVSYQDVNTVTIGASTVATSLSVTAGTGVTQSGIISASGGTVGLTATAGTVGLGANITAMTLNLSASGAGGGISQSAGTISAAGTTTVNAGAANNVTLNQATNDFGTVAVTNGAVVAYTDANGLTVGNSTAATSLTVSASGAVGLTGTVNAAIISLTTTGAVTQSAGSITSSGTTTVKTQNNAGAAITLTSAGNNFGTLDLRSRDAGDSANAAGAISLRDDTGGVIIAALQTTGAATLDVTGTATQTTAIAASGLTLQDTAGTGNFTLTTTTNVVGTLTATSVAGTVSYYEAGALAIAASSFGGAATITATGAISDSGTITVSSTFTAKTLNNSGAVITLDNSGNDFSTIDVQARNAGDTANVAGAITVRDDTGGVIIAGLQTTAAATLDVTGTATQTAAISAAGLSLLNSAGTGNFTLTTTTNVVGTLSATIAGNVSYTETGVLSVNASTIGGNATFTATGAITDGGSIVVTGTLTAKTLNNSGAAITLDNAGNNFGTVDLRTRNAADAATVAGAITLRDDTSGVVIALVQTTAAATLDVTGNVTQTGAITATGLTLQDTAGTGNFTLTSASNDVGTLTANSVAGAVSYTETGALDFAAGSIGGNAAFVATGAITQSGAIAITGTTSITAGTNAITLTNASNDFGGTLTIVSGSTTSVVDANMLTLASSTITGAATFTTAGTLSIGSGVTITATGGFTKSGAGTTFLAGNVVTTNAAITWNSSVTLTGSSQLNSGNAVSTFAAGTLTLGVYTLTTNSITLASGVTLNVTVFSGSPASQIVVLAGNVVLNNNPMTGTGAGTVTLVDNQAGNAITGQFLGGTTVVLGGIQFGVLYTSGSNNIVLVGEEQVSQTVIDPLDASKTAIFIVGLLPTANTVSIARINTTQFYVTLNGTQYLRTLPTGHLVFLGGDADDRLEVVGTIGVSFILHGGLGDDYLVGGNAADIILGEEGNDTVYGGFGRDLIIGGLGADAVYGGSPARPFTGDGDLLIGVSTIYDASDTMLAQISAAWARTDLTPQQRINNLTRGTGGVPIVSSATLIDDLSRNTITGSQGADWIWASNLDGVRGGDDFRRLPIYRFADFFPMEPISVSADGTSVVVGGPIAQLNPVGFISAAASATVASTTASVSADSTTSSTFRSDVSVPRNPTRSFRDLAARSAETTPSEPAADATIERTTSDSMVRRLIDLGADLLDSIQNFFTPVLPAIDPEPAPAGEESSVPATSDSVTRQSEAGEAQSSLANSPDAQTPPQSDSPASGPTDQQTSDDRAVVRSTTFVRASRASCWTKGGGHLARQVATAV